MKPTPPRRPASSARRSTRTGSRITSRKRSETALREADLKFRALTESASDAIVASDETGRIRSWNRGAQLIFGYDEHEVIGQPLAMLMPERFREMHERGMSRFLRTREPRVLGSTVVVVGLDRAGEEFPVELSLAHWEGEDRNYFIGILRDITDRVRAETALARETSYIQLLQAVTVTANESSDGGEALTASLAQICTHTGWSVGHVYWVDHTRRKPLVSSDIWHLDDLDAMQTFREVTYRTSLSSGEGLPGRVLATGKTCWIVDVTQDDNYPRAALVAELGIRAGLGCPVMVGRDVVAVLEFYSTEPLEPDDGLRELMGQIGTQLGRVIERQRSEEQLTHLALHDALTGLPNRTLFLNRLEHSLTRVLRSHHSLAVLFIDLDRFKLVNDSLGHEAGDHLLRAVGKRLRSVLRPGDTVARFGGDEFVVLCEAVAGAEDAAGVAERLSEALSAPFMVDGQELFVSASIGIALNDAGTGAHDLVRDADAALYRAKEDGGGRHELFNDIMRTHAVERLQTANALHRALERQEFILHFQPQVSMDEGRVVGAEALVRWMHPERGLISPLDFIPLAEETGLIVPLGRWVLHEACRQGRRWHDAQPHEERLGMSVNLSGRQLQQPDLVEVVQGILLDTGFEPRSLVLEITESVLMWDTEAIIEKLVALKRLGLRLAIDDFGTGYSSLTYLRRFPIDVLKIDKSFIDGLDGDPEQSAVAHTIVRLAQTLNLSAVAEGVERIEQVNELQALRCDHAQGFYYARPLEAIDFEHLLIQSLLPPGRDGAGPAITFPPAARPIRPMRETAPRD